MTVTTKFCLSLNSMEYVVMLLIIFLNLRSVFSIQAGDFMIIKGQKQQHLNVSGSSVSSPRSRIECADWCLRYPWCVAATFLPSGGPSGLKCFPSSLPIGCLENDDGAFLIKKKKIIPAVQDCKGLLQAGFLEDGTYRITPDGSTWVDVVCDMTTYGGGWTVFQQRWNGAVDFYRNWAEYIAGFGDFSSCGEHWLGLDTIHRLTLSGSTELYVLMRSANGADGYAKYSNFSLDAESNNYTINIAGYTGAAGDSLFEHDGKQFSTFDHDSSDPGYNCPVTRHGAWWYFGCYRSNLNGQYLNTTSGPNTGMRWRYNFGFQSLMHTKMMLRRFG